MVCRACRLVVDGDTRALTLLPFLYQIATIQRRAFSRSTPRHDERPQNHEGADRLESELFGLGEADVPSRRKGLHLSSKVRRPERNDGRDSGPFRDISRDASKTFPRSPNTDSRSGSFFRPPMSNLRSEHKGSEEYAKQQRFSGADELPFESGEDGSLQTTNDPFGESLTDFSEEGDVDVPEERPARDTTMTQIERDTFARLFDTLTQTQTQKPLIRKPKDKSRWRNRGKGTDGQATTEEPEEMEGQENFKRFSKEDYNGEADMIETYSDLEGILHELERNASGRLSRFPKALQGMAAKAEAEIARKRHIEKTGMEPSQDNVREMMQAEQRAEMKRIENELYRARTDVAIWEVLKSELFPKIKKLDEEVKAASSVKSPPQDATMVQDDSKGQRTSKQDNAAKKPKSTPHTLPLTAYPALCLLALRLLTRRTAYTPLAQTLLSQIRSQSPSSYVLCASTAFYNELLMHHFRLHTSPSALLSLLAEMHEAGLTGDGGTLTALNMVTRYRHNAVEGGYGEGVRALEEMQGRSAEWRDVERWKGQIRGEIEGRAMEVARRAEQERWMREQGVLGDDEDEEGERRVAAAA